MQFDTTLSLDLVLVILTILASVWRLENRLDKKLSDQSDELKKSIAGVRTEAKSNHTELKAANAELRKELKADNAVLRADLRRVEDKVDESNQRVARLEGIILAREDMIDTIADSPQ